MPNLTEKKLAILETLIDDRREMYGLRNTICFLLDNGFTKEDLLEMKFDEDDVVFVCNNPYADYDLS